MNLTWAARVMAISAFLPSLGVPNSSKTIYKTVWHIDVGPDILPGAELQQRYEPVYISDAVTTGDGAEVCASCVSYKGFYSCDIM